MCRNFQKKITEPLRLNAHTHTRALITGTRTYHRHEANNKY